MLRRLALTVGRSTVAVSVVGRALALVVRWCGLSPMLEKGRLAPPLLLALRVWATRRSLRARSAAAVTG